MLGHPDAAAAAVIMIYIVFVDYVDRDVILIIEKYSHYTYCPLDGLCYQ